MGGEQGPRGHVVLVSGGEGQRGVPWAGSPLSAGWMDMGEHPSRPQDEQLGTDP